LPSYWSPPLPFWFHGFSILHAWTSWFQFLFQVCSQPLI
jgi:hypothetical protein